MAIEKTGTQNPEEKLKFNDKLNIFLQKNRILFIGIAIAIVVALIALFIYTAVSNQILNSSTLSLEKIESSLEALSSEADETVKENMRNEVIASIDLLVKKYRGSYSAQKALLIKAQILYDKKDWAKAEESYKLLADTYSKSYLAPLALTSAAACAEERGETDSAISFYSLFLQRYEKKAVGTPHALFSLGRLYEEKKDFPNAKIQYDRLFELYPDDNWTKFGKSRIILLKSQGLIQ